jgi:DNA-binding LytR/AlgR family response regulator
MNILICDTDTKFAEEYEKKLLALAAKHNIDIKVYIVESGKKLLFYMDTKFSKLDLIYMEYEMEELNGIETAHELRKNGVTADIVFVSKDAKHAIAAYDVDALYYIVKGKTDDAKFEEIFLKAVRRRESRRSEVMTFSHADVKRTIPVVDILYFEVKNRTVTVHYQENKESRSFDFTSSLTKIADRLNGEEFERIHGSYLVAVRHIAKRTSQQIVMSNGDTLPIGRTYQRKNTT